MIFTGYCSDPYRTPWIVSYSSDPFCTPRIRTYSWDPRDWFCTLWDSESQESAVSPLATNLVFVYPGRDFLFLFENITLLKLRVRG